MTEPKKEIFVIVRGGDVETDYGFIRLKYDTLASSDSGEYAPFFDTYDEASTWLKRTAWFCGQRPLVQSFSVVRLSSFAVYRKENMIHLIKE